MENIVIFLEVMIEENKKRIKEGKIIKTYTQGFVEGGLRVAEDVLALIQEQENTKGGGDEACKL